MDRAPLEIRIKATGQLEVDLRAIDTETTRVPFTVARTWQTGEDSVEMAGNMANEFQKRVALVYPIRARVTEVRDGEVVLNVGRLMGVVSGMRMQVKEGDAKGIELTVKNAQERSCTAIFSKEAVSLKKSYRVEEVRPREG